MPGAGQGRPSDRAAGEHLGQKEHTHTPQGRGVSSHPHPHPHQKQHEASATAQGWVRPERRQLVPQGLAGQDKESGFYSE